MREIFKNVRDKLASKYLENNLKINKFLCFSFDNKINKAATKVIILIIKKNHISIIPII